MQHNNRLYDPSFEKDGCGYGLIAHRDDTPSHHLVTTGIKALSRLTHRGAIAADGKTGDGCGLLLKKPELFLRAKAEEAKLKLAKLFAAGTVFLPRHKARRHKCTHILEQKLIDEGLTVAGWREVPTDISACGAKALETLPFIAQIFVNATNDDAQDFERRLFIARRRAEIALGVSNEAFYVASLSSRVIAYKGLIMPKNLPVFYEDLRDSLLQSSICLFHQRFSTNTWPQWRLAQPFRFLAHNGEINTISSNRVWASARAHIMNSPLLPALTELAPIVSQQGSDSSSLDNMLELLLAGGLDIFRAMRMLIPPAWQNTGHSDPDLRAFYSYHSMHSEPWDGPAAIALTDGRYAACALDRNGLRPSRYVVTRDRLIILATEAGVCDYKPQDVVLKGRLKPGEMIAADTLTGRLILPEEIDDLLKSRQPYYQWVKTHTRRLTTPIDDDLLLKTAFTPKKLAIYEKMFDVSSEECEQVIKVLAKIGQEAIGSMGDDTPLPVFSTSIRSLFDNFRQIFAQVTNPPIDSLREKIVMSLETSFGEEANPFVERPEHARRLALDSPVLSEHKYNALLENPVGYLKHQIFDLNIREELSLQSGLLALCDSAIRAVQENGVRLLVLSDQNIRKGYIPMHSLLACGALHHRLIRAGLRCRVNIVINTGWVRDPHHFAILIGSGATAIHPYLTYQILHALQFKKDPASIDKRNVAGRTYRKAINKGLYKILSKMGISAITSYRGGQLFEIVGLHQEILELCFASTSPRLQGMKFSDLHQDQVDLARRTWNPHRNIRPGGLLKYHGEGEFHAFNPQVVMSLRAAASSGDYEQYKVFAAHVNQRQPMVLRDLLALKLPEAGIPLSEVESAETILPRFDSAGMSLGALSPEAHETLAEAMNALGGRSNSGEGGESSLRFNTPKNSKIKQIASGRFGVTPYYLVNAEVLQIKIAQGAKPGEGGQLPGHKVNDMIAKLRFSKPGISLISPPPHHDIYSIEDLAQLIFDLKQVNPAALVSVKLVAQIGVGTVAVGVAKAYADLITISGYDGGTGASPLSSIKYAGGPWELGLRETHNALIANGLRHKIRLQTDGGLKTGLDIVKAAILGAESFGFGTAPMIAMGCKYLRICHLNNCATGVATQNSVLRRLHFIGKKEMVINYFRFVAEELREWMALLGVRNFTDLIGKTELLEETKTTNPRLRNLSADVLLDKTESTQYPVFCTESGNPPSDQARLANRMLKDMGEAIIAGHGGEYRYEIFNTDRSIGALISGEIAKHHGKKGLADTPITVKFEGTAGQSFGAWNSAGLNLRLEGDANDYVGKGMAGGELVLLPPHLARTLSQETPIMGNTCLYGATGGKCFAAGTAGERFAVRNSGTIAVVEGTGDHACEYMTGGAVVVLGRTGVNFGAGMTGGMAFVFDQEQNFSDRYNRELVEINRLDTEIMESYVEYLYRCIHEHVSKTNSQWGQNISAEFGMLLPKFWFVKPKATELETLLDSLLEAA